MMKNEPKFKVGDYVIYTAELNFSDYSAKNHKFRILGIKSLGIFDSAGFRYVLNNRNLNQVREGNLKLATQEIIINFDE